MLLAASNAKRTTRKRKLEEIKTNIPHVDTLDYVPLLRESRKPEVHLPADFNFTNPLAYFQVFFTPETVREIVKSTNSYAKKNNEAVEAAEGKRGRK